MGGGSEGPIWEASSCCGWRGATHCRLASSRPHVLLVHTPMQYMLRPRWPWVEAIQVGRPVRIQDPPPPLPDPQSFQTHLSPM